MNRLRRTVVFMNLAVLVAMETSQEVLDSLRRWILDSRKLVLECKMHEMRLINAREANSCLPTSIIQSKTNLTIPFLNDWLLLAMNNFTKDNYMYRSIPLFSR